VLFQMEFYWVPASGDRAIICRRIMNTSSLDRAACYSRAMLKNVLLEGRRANLCVIKTPGGRLLAEVDDASVIDVAALFSIDR
jgi:hypothetical protein